MLWPGAPPRRCARPQHPLSVARTQHFGEDRPLPRSWSAPRSWACARRASRGAPRPRGPERGGASMAVRRADAAARTRADRGTPDGGQELMLRSSQRPKELGGRRRRR
eukprot:2340614-Pyramimonas_sp.AAC.1